LRSLGTPSDGPSTNFVRAAGEVANEVERIVAGMCNLGEVASGTNFCFFFLLFFGREARETLFERDGEGDEEVARVVGVDPSLDLGEPLVLFADVIAFGEVDEVGDGFGSEELEAVDDVDLGEGE